MSILLHQCVGLTGVPRKARLPRRHSVLILLDHHDQLTAPFAGTVLDQSCGLTLSDYLSNESQLLRAATPFPIPRRTHPVLHLEGVSESLLVDHTRRELRSEDIRLLLSQRPHPSLGSRADSHGLQATSRPTWTTDAAASLGVHGAAVARPLIPIELRLGRSEPGRPHYDV